MKKLRILMFILIVLALCSFVAYRMFLKNGALYIAMAGPMSGPNAQVGKSFYQGIRLYIDTVNQKGGIHGKKIKLKVFDDQNNSEEAKKRAIEIRDDNECLAVIGHHYSSCSIAAGEIYKKDGIPAVSPASTNVKVTKSNEWYFRSSFNDDIQGQFLVAYAKNVLGQNTVSIIREDQPYGAYLATVFDNTAAKKGVHVRYRWKFKLDSETLEKDLSRIVNELYYQKKDAGAIFLATHAGEGVRLVKKIKDRGITNPILAPDAFASEAFQKAFNNFPMEKRIPGYYTNGIYVTTPWTSDITNEKGLKFQEAYETEYGEEAGWHAAFAYDTAMVVIEAIENAEIKGDQKSITEDRKKIRDYLAGITTVHKAVEGVTGFNYFDEHGDSQKPIFVANYKHQRLISALTQFQAIPNIYEVPNREEKRKKGLIEKFNDKDSYKVNVVYTGIEINEISELDVENFTHKIDFYLWFRYQGEINVEAIEFLNAMDAIPLKDLAKEKPGYSLFHITGKFRADFLPNLHKFGSHILGIRFRSLALDRNNLILVKDVLGMRLSNDEELVEKMNNAKVLNAVGVQGSLGRIETTDEGGSKETVMQEIKHGWKISEVLFFQDIAEESLLGDPESFNVRGGVQQFSRFNLGIRIVEDRLTLRRIISPSISAVLLVISFIGTVFMASLIESRRSRRKKAEKKKKTGKADEENDKHRKKLGIFPDLTPHAKPLWVVQLGAAIILFLSAEVVLLDMMSDRLTMSRFESIVLTFDVLWWVLAAYFATLAVERFLWRYIEDKSGQPIPGILRVLGWVIIFTVAMMIVVAFVFDQKLTSLLATGGVVAMIVGLAIQINIANIFSGIALNLERPFKIDDWVQIGDFTEGKVIDINWRATRIKTRDATELSIPNSKASESPIENFTRNEDKGYWKWFTFHVDPHHPPDRVKKVLRDAALSVGRKLPGGESGALHTLGPAVRFLGLTRGMTGQSESWAANYLIGVFFSDYGEKFAHNEAVWTEVWKHFKLAGIKHVMERQEVQLWFHGMKKPQQVNSEALELLNQEIFKPFSHEDKIFLSQRMERKHYWPDQMVVQQGESGESMFIIAEGSLIVKVSDNGKEKEVARLGTGKVFGEMALLTGEKRTATVTSITDTYLYEITKSDIYPLLKNDPDLSRPLSEVVSMRKLALEEIKEGEVLEEKQRNIADKILGEIGIFFGLKLDR